VHHTLAVREVATETLSLLKDAETGGRGFILTDDPQFLAPYTLATGALHSHIARLRVLTHDDPVQLRGVSEIERLAAAKLARLAETIELRRSGQLEQALTMVREGSGRLLMDAIRAEISRLLAREAMQLAQRERAAESAQREASFALLLALILAVAIVRATFSLEQPAGRSSSRSRTSAPRFGSITRTAQHVVPAIIELVERILGRSLSLVSGAQVHALWLWIGRDPRKSRAGLIVRWHFGRACAARRDLRRDAVWALLCAQRSERGVNAVESELDRAIGAECCAEPRASQGHGDPAQQQLSKPVTSRLVRRDEAIDALLQCR
jgi:CHASE3 domain sensor protein